MPEGRVYRLDVAIDLNANLGQTGGVRQDRVLDQLIQVISSANIACGGHAGDADSMQLACAAAASHGLAIGAHVSYRDREGFGRRDVDVPLEALVDEVFAQIEILDSIALAQGSAVTYVKPHGALYHRAAVDPGTADAVVRALDRFRQLTGRALAILSLPGCALMEAAAAANLRAFGEAFADRAYRADGSPLPHAEPGAVITDPELAIEQVLHLLQESEVVTIDGTAVPVKARSICVRGDNPAAVALARRLRSAIVADRVRIAPFAPPPPLRRASETADAHDV